jgi:tetratricopeptide (TPR) repeat protein
MANLAVDAKDFSHAADLTAKLADLMEKDNDPSNDDQIRGFQVQAATWLAMTEVHRYPEAIELYKKAQARELIPAEETLLGLLQTLFKEGKLLKSEAEADSTKKAELEPKYLAVFKEGVDVGTSLVEQHPENRLGYYFLSMCQLESGDGAGANANYAKFEELGKGAENQ